jgi:hypothetical protein
MKQSNLLQNSESANRAGEEFPGRWKSVLKNEDYSGSFNRVETWLRNKSVQTKNTKNERSLVKMKNYFFSHKFRIAYAVIFLAVIVAACNMPVTTHEPIGNVIAWTIPAGNSGAADQISKLPWINNGSLSMNENDNNGNKEILYTLTLQGSTEEQVNTYKKDLEAIKDITSVKILPLNEDVKRPLYSAALHKFFRINVNATNMSNEQVKEEITNKLKDAGIENPDVDISTDANGRRMIKMKLPENHEKNSHGNFELRVNDGNNQEVMKMVHNQLDEDKLKGMTDQQIKDQIKKDNPELNLKDNDIIITRENGNVQVKVERENFKNK